MKYTHWPHKGALFPLPSGTCVKRYRHILKESDIHHAHVHTGVCIYFLVYCLSYFTLKPCEFPWPAEFLPQFSDQMCREVE